MGSYYRRYLNLSAQFLYFHGGRVTAWFLHWGAWIELSAYTHQGGIFFVFFSSPPSPLPPLAWLTGQAVNCDGWDGRQCCNGIREVDILPTDLSLQFLTQGRMRRWFTSLSVYLSIYLSIYLVWWSIYLSIYPSIYNGSTLL